MKSHRFEIALFAILLAFVAAVHVWQNPGIVQARATPQDIDRYVNFIGTLPMPEEDRATTLKRARAWLESDDGKPVYMLNLMRYYKELRKFPGMINFNGTPEESNRRYEDVVVPMLPKVGGYPMYVGSTHGGNLLEHSPDLDNWDRVLLVRYPSRRAFMDLLLQSGYKDVEPYKLMALRVILTPTQPELVIPDLTFIAFALALVTFLAAGWWRCAHKQRQPRHR